MILNQFTKKYETLGRKDTCKSLGVALKREEERWREKDRKILRGGKGGAKKSVLCLFR